MLESPQGYFPDYKIRPVPNLRKKFTTEIEPSEFSPAEQRRRVPKVHRFVEMHTVPLEQSDRKVISDFLDARSGSYESFYFFNPVPEIVASLTVGTVTSDTEIVLPWKGPWWFGASVGVAATISAVTIDDDPLPAFDVVPNDGPGGEDTLHWTGAKSGLVVVSAAHVRLRWIVRNNSDWVDQTFEERSPVVLASFPLSFIELPSF